MNSTDIDIVKDNHMINTMLTESSIRESTMSAFPQHDDSEKLEIFETLGRVSKESDGKIIKDENEEVVRVELKSYLKLF